MFRLAVDHCPNLHIIPVLGTASRKKLIVPITPTARWGKRTREHIGPDEAQSSTPFSLTMQNRWGHHRCVRCSKITSASEHTMGACVHLPPKQRDSQSRQSLCVVCVEQVLVVRVHFLGNPRVRVFCLLPPDRTLRILCQEEDNAASAAHVVRRRLLGHTDSGGWLSVVHMVAHDQNINESTSMERNFLAVRSGVRPPNLTGNAGYGEGATN